MTSTRMSAAAMAAILALALPGAAAAAAPDRVREGQDRAEIAELMWTYTRALDTLNEEAYARVFVPDGAFGKTKGHDALRKMITDLKKTRAEREAKGEPPSGAMYHVDTNDHVEFKGPDQARYHYYWMTVFAAPPKAAAGAAPRVAAVGHGVDDLVRVNGKWLIKLRNVAPGRGGLSLPSPLIPANVGTQAARDSLWAGRMQTPPIP